MAIRNFPQVQEPDDKPEEISELTRQALYLAGLPYINIRDAQEVEDRCKLYFRYCGDNGKRPFVQGLCLALGITRVTLIKMESENSPRGEVIRRYKQIIRTLLEEWSLTGKLNPATGIFLMKNVLGYKDNITVEAQPVNTSAAEHTPEEIAQLIEQDIPEDTAADPVGVVEIRKER